MNRFWDLNWEASAAGAGLIWALLEDRICKIRHTSLITPCSPFGGRRILRLRPCRLPPVRISRAGDRAGPGPGGISRAGPGPGARAGALGRGLSGLGLGQGPWVPLSTVHEVVGG